MGKVSTKQATNMVVEKFWKQKKPKHQSNWGMLLALLVLVFAAAKCSGQANIQAGLNLSTMSNMGAVGVTTKPEGFVVGAEYRALFGGGFLHTLQAQAGWRFEHGSHRVNAVPKSTMVLFSAGPMQYKEQKVMINKVGYGIALRHVVNGGFVEIAYREKFIQFGVGYYLGR